MSDKLQEAWADVVEHAREIQRVTDRLSTFMHTTFQKLTWQEQVSLLSLLRAENVREYTVIADGLTDLMAKTGKGEPT